MTGFALRAGAAAVGLVTVTAAGPLDSRILGPNKTARWLGAGVPAGAVQAAQEQRPIFRGGANVVRVDVTVTNRRGEPATDLTRDDFSVTEDGAPQTIDSFELVHVTGEPADDRSLEIRSASQVAVEAARDDVRLFLIFWDEYHIGQFIPATRGREVLTEFVRTAFGPTDLVGIMDQLTTVESIKFTRDRLQLADQVHALKGRLGVLVPARSVVEEAHLQYPRDINRLRNEVTTSALNAAAAFLGNFREGRKALLFVSQGIPVFGRNSESKQYMDIVRTANTNNTAIYTLDPASEVGRRPDSLLSLAYETGGRPFVGSNRPAVQLPQMVRDASAYYLLGYRSPAPVDGKFHRIRVRLNKDGYEVRARSGYFAPSVGDMERGRAEAAAAELPPDIERALGELSLTERSDRQIDYWIGMSRGEAGRTRVTIAWTPRARASTGGEIALAINAASPDGTSYFTTSRTTSREVSFDAPAGELVLATKALNARGDEIDGDMRRVTVPAFDGSKLAIGSPMVLRTRTAREARAITEGTDAQPEVGREFDRSDRLFVRFPVYGGPEAAATARLLNRRGKELRELPVVLIREGLYQLDLPLSVSARGDYLIAIEAARGAESVRALVPVRVR
jgi:VWFA-related protein